MIRFGGPIFGDTSDPKQWAAMVREKGYTAAYSPANIHTSDDDIRAYVQAAHAADIVIAEVGAWSNPISADDQVRRDAIEHCQKHLALADQIGALCCVNISGSRGAQWDGPDAQNLTPETFDLIVDTVREIIDAVQPVRTYYTLETMPWAYPDSPQSYLQLVKAIDRERFAVHLDPVNIICSPQLYFGNAALIRECFALLGPHLKGCHAKDITLAGKLTVHLDEVRPGLGGMDYAVLLREMDRLGSDVPLMLEHLPSAEEYDLAAAYIRSIAQQENIPL